MAIESFFASLSQKMYVKFLKFVTFLELSTVIHKVLYVASKENEKLSSAKEKRA